MKTIRLGVAETLEYYRQLVVEIPDEMDENKLEEILREAQRFSDSISEFICEIEEQGIKLAEPYDNDYDSPDYTKIECDEYEIFYRKKL